MRQSIVLSTLTVKEGKERVHPELSAMNVHLAYLLWCQMEYSGAERDGM